VVDALASARDSGRIVAARPFALGEESPALFLVGAHYRTAAPLRTVAERRAALSGYAGAFFRAAGFVQPALEVLPAGAAVAIFDGERQIFGADAMAGGVEGAIDMGGRTWRLVLRVPGSPALAMPITIAGGGALLTALVALFFALGNRRERDLAEAEGRLLREAGVRDALLDAVPDGIMLVTPAGEVLVANPALERLAQRATGAALGRTLAERIAAAGDVMVDRDRYLEAQRALAADPSLVREDEFELRTGQTLRQFSAPVVLEEGGPVAARVVVTRDVTVERRMDRMKDEFIATASHELRTPLTSILGYVEALREGDAGALAPEQERFLEVIARNSHRLRHLVDDLLDVARADAGRLALSMARVDLGEVVTEASQAARPVAAERGITLSVEAPAGAVVSGDRTRLGQVVDNLVSNALKFTPPGGVVSVAVARERDEVACEVADTGVGIPAAELDRLFERFYRGSRASVDAVQGSGLGLAIAKTIVDAHGGRIALESEEGLGTCVRLTLPAAVPAPAGSPAVSPTSG
jgi:signal transduction histidine kinase